MQQACDFLMLDSIHQAHRWASQPTTIFRSCDFIQSLRLWISWGIKVWTTCQNQKDQSKTVAARRALETINHLGAVSVVRITSNYVAMSRNVNAIQMLVQDKVHVFSKGSLWHKEGQVQKSTVIVSPNGNLHYQYTLLWIP